MCFFPNTAGRDSLLVLVLFFQGENKLILFNQIGNFLRIKGDTFHSIECFRSALLITHNCPDIYLNLARIMLNLNYVKDAVYLAERSLDQLTPEQSTWLQHFTLAVCKYSRLF